MAEILRSNISISFFIFFSISTLCAQSVVHGKISGENGEILIGVSVSILGTVIGTMSDTLGRFSIVATTGDHLKFSYIGYFDQEIILGDAKELNITLLQSNVNLDELVVLGYGTSRRRDLTGAISSVSEKDFNRGILSSPDLLIKGKVAGVQMISNDGVPGGDFTIKIRGNSALTGTSQPLYVVDGVPLDGRSLQSGNNPLNFLNPSDIATIDILKDASATAIYGSRAAYGVVIINTKKGELGTPKLDVSISSGVSSILRRIKVLDAAQYREAIKYWGVPPEIDKGGNENAMNSILQNGIQKNYFIEGSGGNENARYRFSGGYLNQEGIVIKTGFSKYNAGISSNFKFLESRKLGIDLNLNASQYTQVGNELEGGNPDIIRTALAANPTTPLRDSGGSIRIRPDEGPSTLALSEYLKDNLKVTTILGSISPYYKFSDWLEYKLLASINSSTGISRFHLDQKLGVFIFLPRSGLATINENELITKQITHTLNFNKDLAQGIHLNATAGYEYLKYTSKGFNLAGYGVPNVGFGNYGLNYTNYLQFSDPNSREIASRIDPLSELQSFFGRAIINYKDKYLMTATYRADGSTKFGTNNKYGYFPSFALAWNISQENFFNVPMINRMKIRAGWGKTGNQEFPAGSSQILYALKDNGTIAQFNNANPDLQWQSDRQYNLGIDFSILKERLSCTVDYFNKRTTNLLFPGAPIQPAPPSVVRWVNLDGGIINKGFEMMINGALIRKAKLNWDFSFNSTFLKNNVTGLPAPVSAGFVGGGPIETIQNGLPIQAFYTRKFLGLAADGYSTYVDDGNTFYYVGDPNPKVLLGISSAFNYKKISVIANMNGTFGQDIYNETLMNTLNVGGINGGNMALSVYQNPVKESLGNPVTPSSRYIQNGDYMKLTNLTISYKLGTLAKAFKEINLYATAQNLFILTNYPGFDPEVNVGNKSDNGVSGLGIDFNRYPSSRSFIAGINFSL